MNAKIRKMNLYKNLGASNPEKSVIFAEFYHANIEYDIWKKCMSKLAKIEKWFYHSLPDLSDSSQPQRRMKAKKTGAMATNIIG